MFLKYDLYFKIYFLSVLLRTHSVNIFVPLVKWSICQFLVNLCFCVKSSTFVNMRNIFISLEAQTNNQNIFKLFQRIRGQTNINFICNIVFNLKTRWTFYYICALNNFGKIHTLQIPSSLQITKFTRYLISLS